VYTHKVNKLIRINGVPMKKSLRLFIIALSFTFMLSSCNRSSDEVIEDSKTAGHYMGKGLRALGGKQVESRQFRTANDFRGPTQHDFIPLSDETTYQELTLNDTQLITSNTAIPQSSLNPGDPGSVIPGIEGFYDPNSSEEKNTFKHVHFHTDEHVIVGDENHQIIKNIAQYLQRNPNIYLFIEGHCDERGPAAYNLALGTRRSNSTRNALIKEGIDLNRLFTISYGKERPIASGHDSSSWRVNRRAQFKIYR
jgi:peptidoglycan-associated lipoprotein